MSRPNAKRCAVIDSTFLAAEPERTAAVAAIALLSDRARNCQSIAVQHYARRFFAEVGQMARACADDIAWHEQRKAAGR